MKKALIVLLVLLSQAHHLLSQEATKPAVMKTPWTEKVDKNLPLNDYPRPIMERNNWQNLNGQWDFAILPRSESAPERWDGKILVPFPVESFLSGVQKRVGVDNNLWYKRSFTVSNKEKDERVILHFGAIDYESHIFLNGKEIHMNRGGYNGFSIDITPYLKGGNEELVVKVWDPTDEGEQSRGKQVKKPGGIYYTPVTGIWQSVWYEIVPNTYFESYKLTTDIEASTIQINPVLYNGYDTDKITIKVLLDNTIIAEKIFGLTEAITLNIPGAKLWSPDSPILYDLQMTVQREGKVVDEVKGYFGMRKIEMKKDEKGVHRMFLNNKAVFQYGPLDQGYWPDGIYTAPTEEALLFDIQTMKEMGFNMVRKHVKVEPERWYYHCDRVGLIVWQDMPSGFGEIVPVKDHDYSTEGDWLDINYKDVERTYQSEKDFRTELSRMIDQLYNYPSICVWVPFNESWGQFKTNEILDWTKTLDPSRLVDGPSGWIDRNGGEMRDYHLYGDRLSKSFPLEDKRALVIGEFGGLGYSVKEHLYSSEAWSYQGFKNSKELEKAYEKLIDQVLVLKSQGFSAAVYTQLTDVETEINGLMTYDRQVIKIPSKRLKKINEKLYTPKK